jgi:hypothetical protein
VLSAFALLGARPVPQALRAIAGGVGAAIAWLAVARSQ